MAGPTDNQMDFQALQQYFQGDESSFDGDGMVVTYQQERVQSAYGRSAEQDLDQLVNQLQHLDVQVPNTGSNQIAKIWNNEINRN